MTRRCKISVYVELTKALGPGGLHGLLLVLVQVPGRSKGLGWAFMGEER